MNEYSTTHSKKIMATLNSYFEYLVEDIEDIEEKDYLKDGIISHLKTAILKEVGQEVPSEIIRRYVNLVFLTFSTWTT